ncbi:unnamed protein product [Nesidiocoris tenuis]|uniref:Uncharacterized protein n=1 Tax=Nesidiocoris tenuis TaxID=355587 RepID=A0A6H5HT86_9HEMI|nr:unnamed protein product [Nesidiocoris tenuis]
MIPIWGMRMYTVRYYNNCNNCIKVRLASSGKSGSLDFYIILLELPIRKTCRGNILGGGIPAALPADTHEVAAGKVAHAIAVARQRASVAGVQGVVAPGIVASGLVAPGIVAPGVIASRVVAPGLIAPGIVAPGLVSASGLLASGIVAPGVLGGLVAPGLLAH